MAVFITNNDATTGPCEVDFAALWKHYHQAKFLYPAKLGRIKPVMDRSSKGWPALLAAPADIFQMHLACRDKTILSSVCGYRDTEGTYAIQHAVSQGHPQHMIDCLLSITTTINNDPEAQFVCMYFRPENRWPARLVRSVVSTHPPELTDLRTREYLTCNPKDETTTLPISRHVQELEEDTYAEVPFLATAALGDLRATASGLSAYKGSFEMVTERFARHGLIRKRRVLGAVRDGALTGVAICYVSDFPVNFSFLCSRVEILVHPEAPDRATVVRDLARAAIREAALRKEPICALLVDPEDAQAAVAGGFSTTGKRYSNFLWACEGERSYQATTVAFERWYERINRRYGRTSQRFPVS